MATPNATPFHEMDGWIWYDGKLVPWRDATLHVLTHALHYASCVFEGERVYAGQIFKLRDHTDRLIKSGKILGFDVPWTADQIDAACREVCAANKIVDGYVRPVAWRGSEQMGVSAPGTKIHLAIAVWAWPSYFSPDARTKGISMKTSKWRRPAPDTAPVHAKASGLYMICTLSKHEAEAAGYDDALMLDWKGRVAEATGANIFVMFDGKIHTPPTECFLDGITRKTVIQLAKERQFEVIERHIEPSELKNAQEIFVTGTAAEVTPVGKIDDLTFKVGPITQALMSDYDRLVGRAPAKASAA
jgi:branched-chain amino acid aminotransferase